MYPVTPFNSRILKQDVVLSGYNVPAGVGLFIISSHLLHHYSMSQKIIFMCTLVAGRLPELFPEPDKFRPERWSRDNKEVPDSFSSLPFSFGRRMCVGMS